MHAQLPPAPGLDPLLPPVLLSFCGNVSMPSVPWDAWVVLSAFLQPCAAHDLLVRADGGMQ